MKRLIEYISESLLDDEDVLINNTKWDWIIDGFKNTRVFEDTFKELKKDISKISKKLPIKSYSLKKHKIYINFIDDLVIRILKYNNGWEIRLVIMDKDIKNNDYKIGWMGNKYGNIDKDGKGLFGDAREDWGDLYELPKTYYFLIDVIDKETGNNFKIFK